MEAHLYMGSGGAAAPCICMVDMVKYPFPVAEAAQNLRSNVLAFPFDRWDDRLTPWPATGLYHGDADFGGQAAETLAQLMGEYLPQAQKRFNLHPSRLGIAGYSLGGLFSLYAFAHEPRFAAAASLSGSVWYEHFTERLAACAISGTDRFVYLSLGLKEKHARETILKTVQDRTERTSQILQRAEVQTQFELGPGGHFDHGLDRLRAGLEALDGFLSTDQRPSA